MRLIHRKSTPSCWCLKAGGNLFSRLFSIYSRVMIKIWSKSLPNFSSWTSEGMCASVAQVVTGEFVPGPGMSAVTLQHLQLRQFSLGDKLLLALRQICDQIKQATQIISPEPPESIKTGWIHLWWTYLRKEISWGQKGPNLAIPSSLHCDNHLTQAQRVDVAALQQRFGDVFHTCLVFPLT